mmetsp:Transcript_18364/g.49692  ORF Transcript_18364/g.49692 Transcript_18364/m.49692 type:complete len:213 (-) Transcript_18364:79-717(-)
MPRNKAGGGRSGMKQLKRQVKYAGAKAAAAVADTTIATSRTSQDVAATKEDELEEQTAADAVGAQVKKKVRFAQPVSNVRWSTVQRRRTMPGSGGWTWGGERDYSTEFLRRQYLEKRADEWVGSWAWPVQEAQEELFPVLWGLRVAEHVAAGCEGEWPAWNSLGPVLPRDFRSHRDWCPRFAGTCFDPNAEANSYLERVRGEAEAARGLAQR